MKYDQLSKADRAAVDRAIGRRSSTKERTRARPSRAEVVAAPGEQDPGGACSCGQPFPTYKDWEKHRRDEAGPAHARWNITVVPLP